MSRRVSRKEGVGSRRRPLLRLATGSDEYRTDQRCPPETAPPTGASFLGVEPLDRRLLVSKTLNVDAVLAPYQFDVLMGDAQLLGITQEGDLM